MTANPFSMQILDGAGSATMQVAAKGMCDEELCDWSSEATAASRSDAAKS
jgi:hypothetical protein